MKINLTNFRQLLKWKVLVSLGMLLFFAGCVEFEGQTFTYRYDREKDRLLCFQVYENIHSSSKSKTGEPQDKSPSAGVEEQNQLKSVMKGQRTFFFDNFVLEYDRSDYLMEKEKTEKELLTADTSEKPAIERYRRLLDTIMDSVEIKNGSFYLNDRKQLCGYQYVIVSNVSKIVSGINDVWTSRIQVNLKKTDAIDEAAWMEIQKAIDEKRWVQIDGNQLRIRLVPKENAFPEPDKDDLLGSIEKNFDTHYKKPFAEIVIGQKDQAITELTAHHSFDIKTNLIKYVGDTYGIRKSAPIKRLREEFLRTGKIPR